MRRARWLASLDTLAVIVLPIMLVACSTSSPDLLNVDDEGNTSIDTSLLILIRK